MQTLLVLHAVGDEGVPFRKVAEVVGCHLGMPVTSVAPVDVAEHFGYLGHLVGGQHRLLPLVRNLG